MAAVAKGETLFLENKSEIRGFVVEDTYFNLQFCTIFFIFFWGFGFIPLGMAKAMSMWDT